MLLGVGLQWIKSVPFVYLSFKVPIFYETYISS